MITLDGPRFFLLRVKSDVSSVLKTFIFMILNQFEKHIKVFRYDNGSEYFNTACSELFKVHGIFHQSCCPYSPQQNRVVERRHRHILETVRAIKFQGNLPSMFWGCCIETSTYIINSVPSTILQDKPPFEMLYGKVTSLHHLRVVGCLCYVSLLPRQGKFNVGAVNCILLGYGIHQKGYKVFDLDKKQVFISRDVVFHETIFPFNSTDTISASQTHDPFLDLESPSSVSIHRTIPSLTVTSLMLVTTIFNADQAFPDVHTPSTPLASSSEHSTHDIESQSTFPIPEVLRIVPRKSNKHTKPPIWLKDFVVPHKEHGQSSNTCLYSIKDMLSYDTPSPSY